MAEIAGKVFVWQWGRRGAGPRLAYELAWALRTYTSLQPVLSLSSDADLCQDTATRQDIQFPVPTYRSTVDAVIKSLRLPWHLRTLDRFIDAQRPDAAISVMPGYWDVLAALRLARRGIPLLTIVHDAVSHPGDHLAPIVAMHRRQIARSDAIITLSDFVAGRLRHQSRIMPPLWTIAHPALSFPDKALPDPAVSDFSGQRPLRILLTGRLKRYKGVQLLIDAVSCIDPGLIELRIAGAASNDGWLHAARQLANCDLRLGWLSEDALVSEIDRADIVLAPYCEASQSGIVALALARGRPVIATPVGGLPEQVHHHETGLIAEDVTPAAFSACISQFVERPSLYKTCAAGALAAGTSEIGWPVIAPQFADIVTSAVETPKERATNRPVRLQDV